MKISVLIMKQLLGRIPCSEAGNGGYRTGDMPGFMGRISNQDSFAVRSHFKGQAKREKQPSLLRNPQTTSALALLAGPDRENGNSVCH